MSNSWTGAIADSHDTQRRHAPAQRALVESEVGATTFTAALRAAAERPFDPLNPNGVTLIDSQGDVRLSHAELWNAARATAAGLRDRGLRTGDRVLLLLPTSEAYLTTACAAMMLGLVPCTVAAPATRAASDATLRFVGDVAAKLEPSLIVVPEHLDQVVRRHPAIDAAIVALPHEFHDHGTLDARELPRIDPRQALHIQLTSGSTSRPKGVVLSHANVVANLRAIAHAIDYAPAHEAMFSWLPLYHDMGFIQMLLTIYYRAPLVMMSPSAFLRKPLVWLHNISRYRAALSPAPTFAYNLCVRKFDPDKLEGVDLSSWRRAFVGAEPVPLAVLSEFRRLYRPYGLRDDALYPCYGMAETVLATTLGVAGERADRLFGFVSHDRSYAGTDAAPADAAGTALDVVGVGRAVQGLELRIVAPDGTVLPDRGVGEICVRGTSVAQGYFRDSQATAAAIKDGWYHTGDRGYLVEGELFVLGRIKEIIIVRGRNFDPHDIEALVDQDPRVRAGYSVAFGVYNAEHATDEVVVVAETRAMPAEQAEIAQAIQRCLQQAFGFGARELVFVRHGVIPRTTSGKRQRVLSRERYLAGAFHAAVTPRAGEAPSAGDGWNDE